MTGRQVLGLDQRRAARAVELDDPAPVGIGREAVLALDHRRMDLARVAMGDQATALVALARVAEVGAAAVARPPLGLEIQVEVLGDLTLRHQLASRIALPYSSMRQMTPAGTRYVVSL